METSSEYVFPIFISSTENNLVDLRAELARHLSELGYRPILSSSDGFPDSFPQLEPWESCLPVLRECFVMILVIDGRYGQALDWPHFSEVFVGRKVSPTHGEYIYGHKLKKRMLVFIRRDVLTFYESFKTVMENTSGNLTEAKKLLQQTLPVWMEFETLNFISELKTTQPIPWIKPFENVNAIKQEIQKKMLNELAEVFLIKSQHLEVVKRAFSNMLEDLTPGKRKEILQSIGVTRELIEDVESKTIELKRLKEEFQTVQAELAETKKSKDEGEKTEKEKEELEEKVAALTQKQKELEREIQEYERARRSYIGLAGNTPVPGIMQDNYLSMLGYSGVPNVNIPNVFNPLNPVGSIPSYTYSGMLAFEKCDRCGRTNSLGSIMMMRRCPKCGENLCTACWPNGHLYLGTAEVCPLCEKTYGFGESSLGTA
jgi:hypothetical protein